MSIASPSASSSASSRPTLPFASRADSLVGSVIDSSVAMLAAYDHDIVKFGMGSPAPDMLPAEDFARIANSVFTPESFTYGETQGEPVLIDALLNYLQETSQIPVEHFGNRERLVITTGGMQGIDLGFKLFVSPGDLVLCEAPTYTNGSATALSYEAEIAEVPVDDEGMQVDALDDIVARAGRAPSVIYTVPTFQNPAGVTMSLARREKLLEFAHRHNSVILEDNPYGTLRFSGEDIPSLSQLSPNDPLIFGVRTFSKFVAPGLRIGWLDIDPELRGLIINAKQTMDSCTSLPTQHMVAKWLNDGNAETHVAHLRSSYGERKAAMTSGLERLFGEEIRSTDPDGGFFLWVTFNDETINTEDLMPVALEEGVAYIPGTAFSQTGDFTNALRLCFASAEPQRIEEGLQRLRRAVDKYSSARSHARH
ncbi:aminotransferase-like domain-containing protein [Brevibacterium sp. UCMA 11754]|uniref:aminotransferase-like domain-containing protein n=1 Tax=Brevibacterium sp. UCMA 11754 TaxID=2749198 RepID=UPI001F45E220|nr:PLP-dependent aminotransferase family protein [Brevibacterium sp. UCMA 11754]MCF2570738.1 PLP-dependent aminotransferase family protein [Brevibacterium sp. UCMA 11754]